MELVLKGRGDKITEQMRATAEHKLERLGRLEHEVIRCEVEITLEKNPSLGGAHHVEVALDTPRKIFRASADAKDVGSALDEVAEKLERQIRDHHTKKRSRLLAGAGRVKSAQASPGQTGRGREGPQGIGGLVTEKPTGTDTERLRVLVCDDHALFRRGLQMVLEQEADLELVGEASDGVEAVQKAQELMPDVILMDVRMPKRSGIEAAGDIKDVLPHVKILMLTISDEEADLYEAIKAGASGYLLKEIPIDEVAEAIRSVWAGQSRISPSMASKLLTEFAAMSKASSEKPQVPTPHLTDREMEVLRLVAQGLNNRDIAKQLFISENTVKNHIRNILEKLHLHSRMEAVVYAVREKLLEIT
jgi:two-component system NarL family response regulator